MSIDEMIRVLTCDPIEDCSIHLRKVTAKQIIAALKAGQAMRGSFILPGHPECPPGMIAAVDYQRACETWDAATKEGEA